MNNLERFEYSNSWSSPRFFFKKNIGDAVEALSYAHGLDLAEFYQDNTFFNTLGGFKIVGDFYDVMSFGMRLETDYGQYLNYSDTDWDYYKSYYEGTI